MRLLDTRTGHRVDIDTGRTLRVYVCGITPYDVSHLGHAFTYTAFDALIRFLEHAGHRVRYARNVTDVDDDILRAAKARGMDYLELGRAELARMDADLAALGNRPPDVEPLATQTIPAIVHAVQALVTRAAAYALPDGRVYFDTGAAPAFGAFARLDTDEMLRQFKEKGGDPDAQGKRNPLDFLLWQPWSDGEPAWDSPWGPGRPGWHIECSVMAAEELGSVIDIHGGGSDLVFPHHEAEVLQAETLTGQGPFARAWLHTGMVRLDGVKMSKSLGNLVLLGDLLARHDGATLRRYLLSHHYRSSWDHDEADVNTAAEGVARWRAAGSGSSADLAAAFDAAMRDDLDTPAAIAVLDRMAAVGAGTTLWELAGAVGFTR